MSERPKAGAPLLRNPVPILERQLLELRCLLHTGAVDAAAARAVLEVAVVELGAAVESTRHLVTIARGVAGAHSRAGMRTLERLASWIPGLVEPEANNDSTERGSKNEHSEQSQS